MLCGGRKLHKYGMARSIKDLSPSEVLALAISLEEDDARVYGDFASRLKDRYPATVGMLEAMQTEEQTHAARLIEMHRQRYGDHIPFVRSGDVKGFLQRKPLWLSRTLSVKQVRETVGVMEAESLRFYQSAAKLTTDLAVRSLLNDLAATEQIHENMALEMKEDLEASGERKTEDEAAHLAPRFFQSHHCFARSRARGFRFF